MGILFNFFFKSRGNFVVFNSPLNKKCSSIQANVLAHPDFNLLDRQDCQRRIVTVIESTTKIKSPLSVYGSE
ncbi:hypothetical protein EXN66_Car014376 [Channa argus]|uniref:Uncharacterized protein n=1 Tax=Channa argus TaxID=215402 RepID=A0A6G1Q8F1_CHAAH|nr:hypothetical protein EXN66_Car014376 [Channa argus]